MMGDIMIYAAIITVHDDFTIVFVRGDHQSLTRNAELILGLHPANERRRHKVTPSHWLGANLESALGIWAFNEYGL